MPEIINVTIYLDVSYFSYVLSKIDEGINVCNLKRGERSFTMKKSVKILGLSLAIVLIVSGYVLAEKDTIKPKQQITCPVMSFGGVGCLMLDRNIYTDYQGKRIYFCSKNCLEKFKKRPEKYVKEQENQGVIFEATPSVIPKN